MPGTTFYPFNGRILVKPRGMGRGEVLAAAQDEPLGLEQGDIVYCMGGVEIEIAGQNYVIVEPRDVLGRFVG